MRKACVMKYGDLMENSASEVEKREYLVDGEATSITFRIPRNLKDAFQDEARRRGMSFSAFVRNCMIQELTRNGD